jgi:phenylacetic acid degradation protein PaaD
MEIVEIEHGKAVISAHVLDRMCNGMGVCHGGMIFTLADTAMAYASNSYDQVALASTASIDFTHSATLGSRILAIATERYRGKRKASYQVTVEDETGRQIAHFQGTVAIIGMPLVAKPGEVS